MGVGAEVQWGWGWRWRWNWRWGWKWDVTPMWDVGGQGNQRRSAEHWQPWNSQNLCRRAKKWDAPYDCQVAYVFPLGYYRECPGVSGNVGCLNARTLQDTPGI